MAWNAPRLVPMLERKRGLHERRSCELHSDRADKDRGLGNRHIETYNLPSARAGASQSFQRNLSERA